MALQSWEQRLNSYTTDQDAATQELLRTKRVAEARSAQGLDISAQTDWANKIRATAGLGAEYGAGVTAKQATRNYDMDNTDIQIKDKLAALSSARKSFTAADAMRGPEYKAAQQLAERQARRDTATTAERLNSYGIANSSSMGNETQRINENASDKLALMVPGIIQNFQAQDNAERADQFNILNSLVGLQSANRGQANYEDNTAYQRGMDTKALERQSLLDSLDPKMDPSYKALTLAAMRKDFAKPSGGSGGGGNTKVTTTERSNAVLQGALGLLKSITPRGEQFPLKPKEAADYVIGKIYEDVAEIGLSTTEINRIISMIRKAAGDINSKEEGSFDITQYLQGQ